MPPTSSPRLFLRPARLALTLAVLVPLLALLPLGRLARDWVAVAGLLRSSSVQVADRGYDWVQWEDVEGQIVARYVFPRSPAENAGVRAGDIFVSFEEQMIFGADELKRVISGIPPGTQVDYELVQGNSVAIVPLTLTRYPTFLYPLEAGLWFFTLWGFLIGTLLHALGLAIAIPLARSSLRARFSLGLILVSSVWIFSNLARLLLIEFFGPAGLPGSRYDLLFQALTLLGFVGWLLFPALLMSNVLTLSGGTRMRAFRRTALLRYAPPLLLGLLALVTALAGSIGPLSLDVLVGPMLFYAACYIAGAAALSLLLGRGDGTRAAPGGWNRWGSILTGTAATVVALALLGLLPMLSSVEDATLGWLIVLTQLLSVAPITLVTLSTLRYGKVNTIVSAALVNGIVATSVFIVFTGTLYALSPVLQRTEAPVYLIGGGLCVALLMLAERAKRWLRDTPFFLTSEQQQARIALRNYANDLNAQLDADVLAHATVALAGRTVNASSAVLFYRMPGEVAWRSAAYHPAPPHLTAGAVQRLWPELNQQLWARDGEVSDVQLPAAVERDLRAVGAAVVLPIQGDTRPLGLLALADKRGRRSVYNLEDLDFLRILCGQFGLAVERLGLIEREKLLAREHAEAQLVALRAQINPHFLFNALNTIASLVAERPVEAEQVVEHLSAMFRHTLQTADAAFVPLSTEIRLVEHYLAIEKARFGEALDATVALPAELRDVPIPPFAVQTLVENSVKHGLAPRRGGGRIAISARATPLGVEVEVYDDGVGISTGAAFYPSPDHTGIGLKNVEARLAHLYGRPGLLQLDSLPGKGTRATLLLPQPTSQLVS